MANVFDQFDQQSAGNVFDQFDAHKQADPQIGTPQELTFAEKYIAPLLDKTGLGNLQGGNAKGAWDGRMFQGLADPGTSVIQLAANAMPGDSGKQFNQAVQNNEQAYQASRAANGSSGFDPLRLAGNTAMDSFIAAALPGVKALDAAPLTKTAVQGAGYSLLNPVTDGGDNYWTQRAKDAGISAVVSPVVAKAGGLLARIVSPNASTNDALQTVKDAGVTPTVGQSLGGWANALEEKAQSLPFMGPFITRARQAGGAQAQDALYAQAGEPIGATIQNRGHAGVAELQNALSDAYETAIPKLSVNVLDPNFVGRMASLRGLAQSLPQSEREQFDNVISREIDDRLAPNGVLSGQDLKDAWNALRDAGQKFSKSPDAYQSDLGQAFKQAFQELKDQVTSTNAPADVLALNNADKSYALFKRIQRASGALGADEGNFTPAQYLNSVKALDTSKDKGRFAAGNALGQDFGSAAKTILTNKVPDSGTAARVQLGMLGASLTGGAFAPALTAPAVAGMGLGALAYTRPVQNALAALVSKRPDAAPEVANYLRKITQAGGVVTVPMLEQFLH